MNTVVDRQRAVGSKSARDKAVVAENLVKVYKSTGQEVRALDGLSLTVEEGRVLGLLGPNGAGKTTTVRILATLLNADSGSATVCGYDVFREPDDVRANIGISGQYASVDENLTGRENLYLFARLYQQSKNDAWARADELLERFDLTDAGSRVVKGYSGGMRRRLDLAGALVGHPRLLILDEPTTGLDPRSRLAMWDVIRDRVKEGTTILLTTQYLEEADELAHTIAVVNHGRIIAEGTADQLKADIGGERIEVVIANAEDSDRVGDIITKGYEHDLTWDDHTRRLTAPAHGGMERLSQIIQDLSAHGIEIDDIGLRRPTLDDVFLALTGHTAESLDDDGDDSQGMTERMAG